MIQIEVETFNVWSEAQVKPDLQPVSEGGRGGGSVRTELNWTGGRWAGVQDRASVGVGETPHIWCQECLKSARSVKEDRQSFLLFKGRNWCEVYLSTMKNKKKVCAKQINFLEKMQGHSWLINIDCLGMAFDPRASREEPGMLQKVILCLTDQSEELFFF